MVCEHGLSFGCKACSDELTAFREWDAVNVCSVPASTIMDEGVSQYAFLKRDPFLRRNVDVDDD